MTPQLAIVSDTICPWCWVGKRHLAAALPLLEAKGLTFDILWRPFQLNPDMPPEGVDRRAYRTAKFGSWERSQQLDAGVARAGAAAGLAFRHDRMLRTPNTILSHVLMALAHGHGGATLQDRIAEALFVAYFTQGQDIGDPETLAAIAAGQGLDPAITRPALADPARAAAIHHEERLARALRLDGVPSFVLDGRLLFSGAQPVAVMVQVFRQAAAALTA